MQKITGIDRRFERALEITSRFPKNNSINPSPGSWASLVFDAGVASALGVHFLRLFLSTVFYGLTRERMASGRCAQATMI